MPDNTAELGVQSPSNIATIKQQRVPRVDGVLKVTGKAQYTSDHNFPGLLYGVPVGSTIASGKIVSIDSKAAEQMKGVVAVYTNANFDKLDKVKANSGFELRIDEARPPLSDNEIRYYGQYVALVVAETFELAQAAAKSIKVKYSETKPDVRDKMEPEDLKKVDAERGNATAAFAKAPVKIDQTYTTPHEYHNPIELHATVAVWGKEGGSENVTLYETSQAIHTHRNVLAQMLGLPRDNVRVIMQFLGSGFGGKLWAWPHSALAAASARKLKRPVKIVIDRAMAFHNVGHRPFTQQRIRLSSDAEGKLQSIQHDYVTQTSLLDAYKENCGEVSGFLYQADNVSVNSAVARRNIGTPTSMRGPGAVPGLFALESALDELAISLNMDPVKLRLANDAKVDGIEGKPFSSRHLKECLELGSQRFGWEKRNPKVGSMKEGELTLGWGVAACTWSARRLDAEATVELTQDGRLTIKCGTHDIGTGMYTAIAQIASDETGITLDRITVEIGDTQLPPGPLAGGSMATASIVPAVLDGVRDMVRKLSQASVDAPKSAFKGAKAEELKLVGGKLKGPNAEVSLSEILPKLKGKDLIGKAKIKGSMGDKSSKVSSKSFGAHFVEVSWDAEIARLRVKRVVSVIDGGHIINYQPAKNQIEGAIVMGIGMAMLEEGVYDERYGQPVNNNLADYAMPVHADMPDIDVTFLDYPDTAVNELGARGIGEIGLAGLAAAITAAVYHATGVRVRSLPVKIENLMKLS